MPSGAIYVGRGSRWGNPFRIGVDGDASECVYRYAQYLRGRSDLLAQLSTLRGRSLACWCPLDQPCHADVLLALANEDASFFSLAHDDGNVLA